MLPVASDLEHADEYPTELVAQMQRPRPVRRHHPRGARRPRSRRDRPTPASSRSCPPGWMSLTGILNTHLIAADADRAPRHRRPAGARLLPRMATGELRGCLSLQRAGRRQRHQRAALQGDARRRRVRHRRHQDVGHQRRARRHRRAGRADARGHHLLHGREGARRALRRHRRVARRSASSATRASRPWR